ncbi:hypothetical protein Pcinc_009214 [Petrolisthes cinctipes]|uniref:Uncharacterized protein n=1 Tax=Petrolisthes cinctipes TaxID=88211 RepID=A0AAE1KVR4_PETCI|nr:hypothetical protein Pcinc_009214 [Petrolisthes cinctipes]
MSITHTTGLHHPTNAHHPHHWASSQHQFPSLPIGSHHHTVKSSTQLGHITTQPDFSVSSPFTQQSPTTSVLEPTATPMPIATSLGPTTTSCSSSPLGTTTTGINIHSNAQVHHRAPITLHTCKITSVHSHFTN